MQEQLAAGLSSWLLYGDDFYHFSLSPSDKALAVTALLLKLEPPKPFGGFLLRPARRARRMAQRKPSSSEGQGREGS